MRKKSDKALALELKRLADMPDEDIDLSDIPERSDWSGAVVGKFYRPIKKQVTLRIDADVLAWFKADAGNGDAGYQTVINRVLREHVEAHAKRARGRSALVGK